MRISDWSSDVCSSDLADLAVILAGNQNVHDRRQRAVAAGEFGVILGKDDFVVVSIAPDWLHTRRPDFSILSIPQEDEGAPIVTGRVLPPSCPRNVAPAAVAPPRLRQARKSAVKGKCVSVRVDLGG